VEIERWEGGMKEEKSGKDFLNGGTLKKKDIG